MFAVIENSCIFTFRYNERIKKTNKKTTIMTNLLGTLSQELQNKLADFKVGIIYIECNEVNIRSEYDMDYSYYEAIERELSSHGWEIN